MSEKGQGRIQNDPELYRNCDCCIFELVWSSFYINSFQIYKSPPPNKELSPGTFLLKVNEIPFTAADGADLHGWLIQGKAGCPV